MPPDRLLAYVALASGIALAVVWVGYPAVVAALARSVNGAAGCTPDRGPWSRRVRRFAVEAVLVQLAVVMAGYNGLRGQWHVWHR